MTSYPHIHHPSLDSYMVLSTQKHYILSNIVQRIAINVMPFGFIRTTNLTWFKYEHLFRSDSSSAFRYIISSPVRTFIKLRKSLTSRTAIILSPSQIQLATSIAMSSIFDVLAFCIFPVSFDYDWVVHNHILAYPQ